MARSSRPALIVRSVQELAEAVRVSGSTHASSALLVARAAYESPGPLVVLCANDDVASDFAADLEALSALVDRHPLPVCHFPTWEQSPYSPIAPSLRTRLARIAVLSALLSEDPSGRPKILVTTIAASCQASIPRALFERFRITVRKDASVESREALALQLTEAGYLRVDPVEDPGTFAVRGDIVDVFPPDRDRPVRVELFGDQVERVREFDPATQRASEGELA